MTRRRRSICNTGFPLIICELPYGIGRSHQRALNKVLAVCSFDLAATYRERRTSPPPRSTVTGVSQASSLSGVVVIRSPAGVQIVRESAVDDFWDAVVARPANAVFRARPSDVCEAGSVVSFEVTEPGRCVSQYCTFLH